MIAIAGGKGGSGKTTTALGLAAAYARSEAPAVTVDADRQLPNLHTVADVERRPTIAEVDVPGDVSSVAQQVTGEPRVGVLPAPVDEESVSYERALATVAEHETRTFVDCPSGAGPDVVEPLSASDRVVVVTSDRERALAAAETTIDVARRVDVPVSGVLLTKSETVPADVERRFEVPILGAVPECDAPLADDRAAAVYDEVVDTLLAQERRPDDGPVTVGDQLATGTSSLDEALHGGVPVGSVVALLAPPASPAERLLHRLTATRGTLYLSTVRSPEQVHTAVDQSVARVGNPTIRHVSGADQLSQASDLVGELPDGANLIVDPVDDLEAGDAEAYRTFLNDLARRVADTDGLAVLHCLDRPDAPRNRSITEHVADVVLELSVEFDEDGRTVTVAPAKVRGVSGLDERVELDLPSDVTPAIGE